MVAYETLDFTRGPRTESSGRGSLGDLTRWDNQRSPADIKYRKCMEGVFMGFYQGEPAVRGGRMRGNEEGVLRDVKLADEEVQEGEQARERERLAPVYA